MQEKTISHIPAHLAKWLDQQIEQDIAMPASTIHIEDPAAVEAITQDLQKRWLTHQGN